MDGMISYLSSPLVVRAFLAVILIAINAGIAGSFAAFRNSTFLVAGASHAALAGAAVIILLHSFGVCLGVDPMIGGAVTSVLLALLAGHAGYVGKRGEVDTAIGVGFAFSMAVAVLLISLIPESASRVWSILMGDLLLVTWSDIAIITVATAVIAALFIIYRREFLFITFDIDSAKAFGIHAERYNLLMFGLIGLSVALLLKGIGAILVFAMMVAPAATSMLIAGSVRRVIIGAMLIAFISGILGIILSFYIIVSVSALTAFFATSAYLIVRAVVVISRRYEKPLHNAGLKPD